MHTIIFVMAQLNLDDLQREISVAESYLKSAPGSRAVRASFPTTGSSRSVLERSNVSSSTNYSDAGSGSSILSSQQLQQQPQASSSSSAALASILYKTATSNPNSPDSVEGLDTLPVPIRYSAWSPPPSTSTSISAGGAGAVMKGGIGSNQKSAVRTDVQPPRAPEYTSSSTSFDSNFKEHGQERGRYSSDKEKELLIARLLAEHDGGRTGTATISSASPYVSSSSYSPSHSQSPKSKNRQQLQSGSPQQQEYMNRYVANSTTIGVYGGGSASGSSSIGSPAGMGRPRSGTAVTDITADSEAFDDDYSHSSEHNTNGGAVPATDTLFFASDLADGNVEGQDAYGSEFVDFEGLRVADVGGFTVDECARTVNVNRAQPGRHSSSSSSSSAGAGEAKSLALMIQTGASADVTKRTGAVSATRKNQGKDKETKDAAVLARARAASGIPSRLTENGNREWKYVKSRDDCLREGEQNMQQQYTFQPVLSTKVRKQAKFEPTVVSSKRGVGTNKPITGSTQRNAAAINQRIEATVKQHQVSLQNRDKLRKSIEDMERAACPFKPQISKKGSSQASVTSTVSATERLYANARTRAEQQEWLEQQVQTVRLAEYTFQPTINPNTKAMFDRQEKQFGLEHVPIHERVADLQKYKTKKLHDLRSAVEESESETLTFAPVIDAHSRQLADRGRKADQDAAEALSEDADNAHGHNKATNMDVADRLLEEGRAAEVRKRDLAARIEREQAEINAPRALSTGSRNIAQSSEFVSASFAQRQALYQNVLNRKSQERRKIEADATAEWFQPNIGKSEEIVAASRPHQFVETSKERIKRLYKEDGELREYRRNIREKEYYNDVTFEPRIDLLSKQMARPSSLNELVDNTKGAAVREAVRKRVEAEQESICTFKPKVAPYIAEGDLLGDNYDNIYGWDPACAQEANAVNRSTTSLHTTTSVVASKQTINMQEPEKMARNIRAQMIAKEEKRRQEIMGREIDELRECTFAPRVGPAPTAKQSQVLLHNQDGAVPIIRGLGRHLELKVLSIRKQEELEQREKEVFGVRHVERYRKKEDGSTVVQPFQLSERDLRPSRAVEDLRKQQDMELTFAPVTEQSLRREAIRGQARAVF